MFNSRRIAAIAIATSVIAGMATWSHADPLPGRDTLKFSQRPMDGTPIIGPNGTVTDYFGHDELSTAYGLDDGTGNPIVYRGRFMADDFADTFNTPVVHVKWWGSYLNQNPDLPVDKFLISFESDEPVSATNPFSHPKDPLLNQIVRRGPLAPGSGTFSEKFISPGGPPLDEALYEYNAELHLDKPFPQDNDTVYWLKIVALVDLPAGTSPTDPNNTRWGWHNRDYTVPNPLASAAVVPGETMVGALPGGEPVWHFQDNAVEGDVDIFPGPIPNMPNIEQFNYNPTHYLDDIDGPGGLAGIPGIGQFSKDLAFELYTIVPEPNSVVLMFCAVFGALATGRRQRK